MLIKISNHCLRTPLNNQCLMEFLCRVFFFLQNLLIHTYLRFHRVVNQSIYLESKKENILTQILYFWSEIKDVILYWFLVCQCSGSTHYQHDSECYFISNYDGDRQLGKVKLFHMRTSRQSIYPKYYSF